MPARRLGALVATALLVLTTAAGCSSDDGDDDADGRSTSSASTGATSTPTAESQAPVELSGAVTDRGTETASEGEIDVDAADFSFAPTFVRATPGQRLRIEIDNDGGVAHTFTSDALAVDEELAPDEDATVEITVPDDGAVAFFCRFHRSQGMQGAIFTAPGQPVTG